MTRGVLVVVLGIFIAWVVVFVTTALEKHRARMWAQIFVEELRQEVRH
jgi:hypothetical protein